MAETRELIEFLRSRRSIRRYLDKPVPEDLIHEILDTARYAPSAYNTQPWRYLVIYNRDVLDKLAEIHGGARPLREAPVAVVVACRMDESPSPVIDCGNTALYIILAAHAHGLGSVWVQTWGYEEKIAEILGLPGNEKPIAIIPLGWPAEKPEPPPRKPLSDLVRIIK